MLFYNNDAVSNMLRTISNVVYRCRHAAHGSLCSRSVYSVADDIRYPLTLTYNFESRSSFVLVLCKRL